MFCFEFCDAGDNSLHCLFDGCSWRAEIQSHKAFAALPEPLAVFESHIALIDEKLDESRLALMCAVFVRVRNARDELFVDAAIKIFKALFGFRCFRSRVIIDMFRSRFVLNDPFGELSCVEPHQKRCFDRNGLDAERKRGVLFASIGDINTAKRTRSTHQLRIVQQINAQCINPFVTFVRVRCSRCQRTTPIRTPQSSSASANFIQFFQNWICNDNLF